MQLNARLDTRPPDRSRDPVAPRIPDRAAAQSPLVRYGSHLLPLFDRLIGASSLACNEPVLDMRDFAWTAILRENWTTIRDEARAVAEVGGWRSFRLHDRRHAVPGCSACPRTAELIAKIPGLHSARLSILAPSTHVAARRGATKGLITCHLGLIVPRDGDVRMRVHDRVVRWAEGETLVFDDTYDHEVWNDTGGTRVVLTIRFERPLRQPGKWFADLLTRFVHRTRP